MTTATLSRYIDRNVYCRCGQAVSRLAEAELIPRPQLPTSELEIVEWWLVSPALAARLRSTDQPVVAFGELQMWGRSGSAGPLSDDIDLVHAIGRDPGAA